MLPLNPLRLRALGFLGGGGAPSMPKPPPPPPPPKQDDSDLEALARKRKNLEASRAGRSQLVIPRDNPTTSGLRIL